MTLNLFDIFAIVLVSFILIIVLYCSLHFCHDLRNKKRNWHIVSNYTDSSYYNDVFVNDSL